MLDLNLSGFKQEARHGLENNKLFIKINTLSKYNRYSFLKNKRKIRN